MSENPKNLTADEIMRILKHRRNIYAGYCSISSDSKVSIMVQEYDAIFHDIKRGESLSLSPSPKTVLSATEDIKQDE